MTSYWKIKEVKQGNHTWRVIKFPSYKTELVSICLEEDKSGYYVAKVEGKILCFICGEEAPSEVVALVNLLQISIEITRTMTR